ncbi:lung adenoma susceptibility protein 2-like [Ptychodera flava]|uniref:lung adenoma susceptibility protein 2-like n=1 Tax=Ptychodera flava TaxID=63121 RepID=UPI00396A1BC5
MSDASDWPLDETEHLLDFDVKTQQHQEDESKILTTPEKHKIKDVFHREKKYRDENYRFGKYKDDSAITSKVGKKIEFKYGNYSRDDSDLGSMTRYFRRSGYKRPLQSMQNLGNTSYSKRSVGNEQSRFSWSAQSRDKSRTPSKTDRGKYGSNLTRSGHDFGVDIASMDTDTLVNQAPLPALLNCSNSTDADNTINDTMIEEAIARARKKCHVDLNTSPLTEDVLDGDRSWEKTVPLRKYPRAGSGSTPLQAASKTGIIDKFLEDCMHSDQENERKASGGDSPRLTGGEQPGPVETLKKMLFKLQSVAADDDDNTNDGTSTPDDLLSLSTVNKEKFDIEPGGKSLLRAMEHLSRLKTLVYSDSETASQKSNSSSTNSSQR